MSTDVRSSFYWTEIHWFDGQYGCYNDWIVLLTLEIAQWCQFHNINIEAISLAIKKKSFSIKSNNFLGSQINTLHILILFMHELQWNDKLINYMTKLP